MDIGLPDLAGETTDGPLFQDLRSAPRAVTGGVDAFSAPWYSSMAGQIPAGQAVTGIAGE